MGTSLTRKPSAILVISGHYLTADNSWLKVPVHFNCSYYNVAGATSFSTVIPELSPQVKIDESTDPDHGAWAILRHIMPDANVPVTELSVPVSGWTITGIWGNRHAGLCLHKIITFPCCTALHWQINRKRFTILTKKFLPQ